MIGIVLFLSIIFAGIKNLLRSKSKDKLMVVTLILGAVLTTFVVNNFDYIPLYIVISGVTYLSRTDYS
jgi:riboflavin transporter FmnP